MLPIPPANRADSSPRGDEIRPPTPPGLSNPGNETALAELDQLLRDIVKNKALPPAMAAPVETEQRARERLRQQMEYVQASQRQQMLLRPNFAGAEEIRNQWNQLAAML